MKAGRVLVTLPVTPRTTAADNKGSQSLHTSQTTSERQCVDWAGARTNSSKPGEHQGLACRSGLLPQERPAVDSNLMTRYVGRTFYQRDRQAPRAPVPPKLPDLASDRCAHVEIHDIGARSLHRREHNDSRLWLLWKPDVSVGRDVRSAETVMEDLSIMSKNGHQPGWLRCSGPTPFPNRDQKPRSWPCHGGGAPAENSSTEGPPNEPSRLRPRT